MSKQPRALELAELCAITGPAPQWLANEAAALLRSQHALIGELVEALSTAKTCIDLHCRLLPSDAGAWVALQEHMEAAISKAKEQQ